MKEDVLVPSAKWLSMYQNEYYKILLTECYYRKEEKAALDLYLLADK